MDSAGLNVRFGRDYAMMVGERDIGHSRQIKVSSDMVIERSCKKKHQGSGTRREEVAEAVERVEAQCRYRDL